MRTWASPPWGQRIYLSYFEFFCIGDCTFSHLSICIDSWSFTFLLWVVFQSIFLFCCSNHSSFGHWKSFVWPHVHVTYSSLWDLGSIKKNKQTNKQNTFFLAQQDSPASSCIIPVPGSKSVISLRTHFSWIWY